MRIVTVLFEGIRAGLQTVDSDPVAALAICTAVRNGLRASIDKIEKIDAEDKARELHWRQMEKKSAHH